MRTIVKESCLCGASIEVSADAYFTEYITERLKTFEQQYLTGLG